MAHLQFWFSLVPGMACCLSRTIRWKPQHSDLSLAILMLIVFLMQSFFPVIACYSFTEMMVFPPGWKIFHCLFPPAPFLWADLYTIGALVCNWRFYRPMGPFTLLLTPVSIRVHGQEM